MFELLGLRVGLLGEQDSGEIDALLVRCADFVRLSEGQDPAPGDGLLLLQERPNEAPEVEKLVLGLYDGPCLIGVIDLLKDDPAPGVWYLGLVLIEPPRRRAGIGAALLAGLGDWVAREGGHMLRLSVAGAERRRPPVLDPPGISRHRLGRPGPGPFPADGAPDGEGALKQADIWPLRAGR